MSSYVKPPLGVMPKYIWDEKRIDELREAIQRYLKGFYSIPIEWVDEYNKLIGEQDERNKVIKKHNDELQKNRR